MEEVARYLLMGVVGYVVIAVMFFLFFYECIVERKQKRETMTKSYGKYG